jgi:hypothetical protein
MRELKPIDITEAPNPEGIKEGDTVYAIYILKSSLKTYEVGESFVVCRMTPKNWILGPGIITRPASVSKIHPDVNHYLELIKKEIYG